MKQPHVNMSQLAILLNSISMMDNVNNCTTSNEIPSNAEVKNMSDEKKEKTKKQKKKKNTKKEMNINIILTCLDMGKTFETEALIDSGCTALVIDLGLVKI